MYLVKTPSLIQNILSHHVWHIPTEERCIYLTFDDGPVPNVTPWVLDLLKEYGFKATFFCVGENVAKYPELYQRLQTEGHTIGNHTYNHLNGWTTDRDQYLLNIEKADAVVDSNLFRPPYGKLKPSQVLSLRERKKIVMWDILSGDFDSSISSSQCLDNVISNYEQGSIIVFHDSLKAFDKLRVVLPALFDHMVEHGYRSCNLDFLKN
jgi:peptidoglycan-N-acetylglucosamine deacetylase